MTLIGVLRALWWLARPAPTVPTHDWGRLDYASITVEAPAATEEDLA